MPSGLDWRTPRGFGNPRYSRLGSLYSFRRMTPEPKPSADESPGVPGFRTWGGIYLFVFASFVLVVVLLAIFSRFFA